MYILQQCNSDVCVCPEMTPPPELRPLVEASFRQHFFQKEHWTFYTEEPELGPCILSIKPEADGSIYRSERPDREGGRTRANGGRERDTYVGGGFHYRKWVRL